MFAGYAALLVVDKLLFLLAIYPSTIFCWFNPQLLLSQLLVQFVKPQLLISIISIGQIITHHAKSINIVSPGKCSSWSKAVLSRTPSWSCAGPSGGDKYSISFMSHHVHVGSPSPLYPLCILQNHCVSSYKSYKLYNITPIILTAFVKSLECSCFNSQNWPLNMNLFLNIGINHSIPILPYLFSIPIVNPPQIGSWFHYPPVIYIIVCYRKSQFLIGKLSS